VKGQKQNNNLQSTAQ